VTWRTDFPPTDRQFLLAWKPDENQIFCFFVIATMTQVDEYGDEDQPLPIYLPSNVENGEELEFDGQTLFAWAEIEPPALGAWADHIVEGFF
jgi:hypothetical protein